MNFDWDKIIDAAAVDGAFEIMTSDEPEKQIASLTATADGLNVIVKMLYDKGYEEAPGWLVLEALSAICLSMYKAVGNNNAL